MKIKNLVALGLIAMSSATLAQKIKLVEGDLKELKEQKGIQIEFIYDSMIVGEELEKTYVKKLKDRWNAEEPGKGDVWKQNWYDARVKLYEPAFRHYFWKAAGMSTQSETEGYTIILKTTFSEPGFDVPGIMSLSARIEAEANIVKTGNPTHVIAKIILSKCKSKSVSGGDFGVGSRLQEAYVSAGKALGEFIKSNTSK